MVAKSVVTLIHLHHRSLKLVVRGEEERLLVAGPLALPGGRVPRLGCAAAAVTGVGAGALRLARLSRSCDVHVGMVISVMTLRFKCFNKKFIM